MKRIHNSNNIVSNFENRTQKQNSKPIGLWYGFGDSWKEWCKYEMPNWIKQHDYEVVIVPERILVLNSCEELRNFTNNFAVQYFSDMNIIDWPKVAQLYSGIEITPHISEARWGMEMFWYMGWDVASGCIWNERGLETIVRLT